MPRERTHLRYQLYRSRARTLAATSAAQLQHELELAGPTDIDLSRVRFDAINAQALDACERWKVQFLFINDSTSTKTLKVDLSKLWRA
ncbi:hypothetical protein V466_09185 [Pseudomonas mandelii PD30]|uniref:Uncharacterized protein n=1 Tax=Pseudomonas mandelii PD30 TaxID=1419583 RepID=A0A059L5N2_9PSED|nr:hypothetical protein V466_09185 [Pseudomonas mandelii PD30]